MILDILSRTTIYLIYSRTITGVLIDPIVFHIWTLYCHILIVLWTLLSFSLSHSYCLILLTDSGSRLSLLFCLGHSHAIVLCRTIALRCISSVTCTPWSHSSFSLTVVLWTRFHRSFQSRKVHRSWEWCNTRSRGLSLLLVYRNIPSVWDHRQPYLPVVDLIRTGRLFLLHRRLFGIVIV